MGVRKPVVSIVSSTKAELERLGALESSAGQLAMVLARRLDADGDAGSAVAAMAKELRATLDALGRVSKPKADPVDELQRKRRQRQAAQGRAKRA